MTLSDYLATTIDPDDTGTAPPPPPGAAPWLESRQVAGRVGCSPSWAYEMLRRLEDAGAAGRERGAGSRGGDVWGRL